MLMITFNFIFRLLFTEFEFIHIVNSINRGRVIFIIFIIRLNTRWTVLLKYIC